MKEEAKPAPKSKPVGQTAPAQPAQPVQVATAPAKKPTPPAKQATKSAPKGSYLLQLLSSKSEPGVQKTWKKISAQNADILKGVSSNIVKADLGDKGIYYRLRLGPIEAADQAKNLCSQLKQRKVGCFIVRVR